MANLFNLPENGRGEGALKLTDLCHVDMMDGNETFVNKHFTKELSSPSRSHEIILDPKLKEDEENLNPNYHRKSHKKKRK